MRRPQLMLEVKEGECQECGMIGLLLIKGRTEMCESCDRETSLE